MSLRVVEMAHEEHLPRERFVECLEALADRMGRCLEVAVGCRKGGSGKGGSAAGNGKDLGMLDNSMTSNGIMVGEEEMVSIIMDHVNYRGGDGGGGSVAAASEEEEEGIRNKEIDEIKAQSPSGDHNTGENMAKETYRYAPDVNRPSSSSSSSTSCNQGRGKGARRNNRLQSVKEESDGFENDDDDNVDKNDQNHHKRLKLK